MLLSDDDKSCWIGSNVVGGKMSGVVVVFRLALLLLLDNELEESIVLLPESTVAADEGV